MKSKRKIRICGSGRCLWYLNDKNEIKQCVYYHFDKDKNQHYVDKRESGFVSDDDLFHTKAEAEIEQASRQPDAIGARYDNNTRI